MIFQKMGTLWSTYKNAKRSKIIHLWHVFDYNLSKDFKFCTFKPYFKPKKSKNKKSQLRPNCPSIHPGLGASEAKRLPGKKLIYNWLEKHPSSGCHFETRVCTYRLTTAVFKIFRRNFGAIWKDFAPKTLHSKNVWWKNFVGRWLPEIYIALHFHVIRGNRFW